MMDCKSVQNRIIEFLPKKEKLPTEIKEHIAVCSQCGDLYKEISIASQSLDGLENIKAPTDLASRVRNTIVEDLIKPQNIFITNIFKSIGLGFLATALTFFLANFNIELSTRTTSEIGISGLLWLASFSFAFYFLLKKAKGEAKENSLLVRTGLISTAAFLVIDSIIPLSSVADFCDTSGWPKFLVGTVGLKGLFLILGTLYALIPLGLFSMATARHYHGNLTKATLVTGGMFFFLIAPSIFLQCQSFTIGALGAWLVGALVGSTLGSFAGIKIYRQSFSHG